VASEKNLPNGQILQRTFDAFFYQTLISIKVILFCIFFFMKISKSEFLSANAIFLIEFEEKFFHG